MDICSSAVSHMQFFRGLQLGLKGSNVEDLKAMKQSTKYIQMGIFVFSFNNLSQIAENNIDIKMFSHLFTTDLIIDCCSRHSGQQVDGT